MKNFDFDKSNKTLEYYMDILTEHKKLHEQHDSDVSKILILRLLKDIRTEIGELKSNVAEFMIQLQSMKVLDEIEHRINQEFMMMTGQTPPVSEWNWETKGEE